MQSFASDADPGFTVPQIRRGTQLSDVKYECAPCHDLDAGAHFIQAKSEILK